MRSFIKFKRHRYCNTNCPCQDNSRKKNNMKYVLNNFPFYLAISIVLLDPKIINNKLVGCPNVVVQFFGLLEMIVSSLGIKVNMIVPLVTIQSVSLSNTTIILVVDSVS